MQDDVELLYYEREALKSKESSILVYLSFINDISSCPLANKLA